MGYIYALTAHVHYLAAFFCAVSLRDPDVTMESTYILVWLRVKAFFGARSSLRNQSKQNHGTEAGGRAFRGHLS